MNFKIGDEVFWYEITVTYDPVININDINLKTACITSKTTEEWINKCPDLFFKTRRIALNNLAKRLSEIVDQKDKIN